MANTDTDFIIDEAVYTALSDSINKIRSDLIAERQRRDHLASRLHHGSVIKVIGRDELRTTLVYSERSEFSICSKTVVAGLVYTGVHSVIRLFAEDDDIINMWSLRLQIVKQLDIIYGNSWAIVE